MPASVTAATDISHAVRDGLPYPARERRRTFAGSAAVLRGTAPPYDRDGRMQRRYPRMP
ncbi:hypothetical protein [Planotetraspora sp. GP83]|uniref:hypothetical protein n=1 Tax=Planotetraspora sp. GP83 TaxID=3156264 RepID=UPI0035148175